MNAYYDKKSTKVEGNRMNTARGNTMTTRTVTVHDHYDIIAVVYGVRKIVLIRSGVVVALEKIQESLL